jgi:hypothetical protein
MKGCGHGAYGNLSFKYNLMFGTDNMNLSDIKKMAKGMGLNTHGMKKIDGVRAIQRAENSIECYGTERVDRCHEDGCLWRNDCFSLSHNR